MADKEQTTETWGKPSAFDTPEQEALLNIMRTHSFLSVQHDRLFKQHDITSQQYNILRILRTHKATGLPSLTIGSKMVTCVPDITRILDRLVKAEYVTRERSLEDRRVVLIKITKAGEKLLSLLDQPVRESEQGSLAHMSKKDLKELVRLLHKVRKSNVIKT